MSKNLVIVESPAKAKKIGQFLGKDYVVMASVGHVRDLPAKKLGVDIEKGFQPEYVDTARGKKVLKEIKAEAKNCERVFLAPDPDREGEAIAWHLYEALKKHVRDENFSFACRASRRVFASLLMAGPRHARHANQKIRPPAAGRKNATCRRAGA